MNKNDLLTIAEREQQRLSDENDHSAAAIMRALIDEVRGKTVSVSIMVDSEAGNLMPFVRSISEQCTRYRR